MNIEHMFFLIVIFYVCGLAIISFYFNYIIQLKGNYFKKQLIDCGEILKIIGGVNKIITDPFVFLKMITIAFSQIELIIKIKYLKNKEEKKLKDSLRQIKIGLFFLKHCEKRELLSSNMLTLSKNCKIYEKTLKYIEQEFGFKSESVPLDSEYVELINYISSLENSDNQS